MPSAAMVRSGAFAAVAPPSTAIVVVRSRTCCSDTSPTAVCVPSGIKLPIATQRTAAVPPSDFDSAMRRLLLPSNSSWLRALSWPLMPWLTPIDAIFASVVFESEPSVVRSTCRLLVPICFVFVAVTPNAPLPMNESALPNSAL
jgi:hypothetical protein